MIVLFDAVGVLVIAFLICYGGWRLIDYVWGRSRTNRRNKP